MCQVGFVGDDLLGNCGTIWSWRGSLRARRRRSSGDSRRAFRTASGSGPRSPKAMAKLETVGEMEENPKEPPPKVKYGLFRDEQEVFEWVKAERAKSPKSNRLDEKA